MYKITVKIQRCFMGNNGMQKTVKQQLLSAKSGVAGGAQSRENLRTRPIREIFSKNKGKINSSSNI